jgi:CubicO group peptidase (beta-lactamase class C family)
VKQRLILFIALLVPTALFAGALPFSLDSCVQACMVTWRVPGVSVAIVKGDSVAVCRGYGVCRKGEKKPVNGSTVFAIGSTTKSFTAAVIATLVKEGKISWDDTVEKRIPGFRVNDEYATHSITIRDILCHRCGYATWEGDLLWYGSQFDDDTLISRLKYLKPAYSLRSRFGYSNLMYMVAGKVIEGISGSPWSTLVKKRLLDPLGMTRTRVSVRELSGLSNVAEPHTVFESKVTPISYRMLDNIGAAGAINASAEDLTKWLMLQLNHGKLNGNALIDSAILEETRTPQMLIPKEPGAERLFPATNFKAYGLGWMLMDYYGRLLVYHGGGVDGMLCRIGFVPEERIGIIVLSNLDNHKLHDAVFFEILDGCLGIPSRDWNALLYEKWKTEQQKAAAVAPRPRVIISKPERYLGTYVNQLYGEAKIFRSGRECVLHLTAHLGLTGSLLHVKGDTMVCEWRDRYFGKSYPVFSCDSMGMVRSFSIRVREEFVDPLEYVFEKRAGTEKQDIKRNRPPF